MGAHVAGALQALRDPAGWVVHLIVGVLTHFIDGARHDVESVLQRYLFTTVDTSVSTPRAFTDNPPLQHMTMGIALAMDLLLAAVLVFALLRSLFERSYRARYSLKVMMPKLMLAIVLVHFALPLTQMGIDLDNALGHVAMSLGDGMRVDGLPWSPALSAPLVANMSVTQDIFHAVFVAGLVIALVLLVLAYVVRYALLSVLVVVAPMAALCTVLPETRGYARTWLRLFMVTVFMQLRPGYAGGAAQGAGCAQHRLPPGDQGQDAEPPRRTRDPPCRLGRQPPQLAQDGMIRIALLAAGAVGLGGAAVGASAASLHANAQVLAAPVAADVAGVSIVDAPDHGAVVHAPAGTVLHAVSTGSMVLSGPARVAVRGTGDDDGLDLDYSGVREVTPLVAVQRGDVVAKVADGRAGVTIHAALDGRPLDVGPLLRSAMSGTPDVTGAWTRPVDGAVVSQEFGCTPYSYEPLDHSCPSGHIHTGIDLAVPLDTPVCTSVEGIAHVVASAAGYGLHVIVDSGDGLTTLYGHLHSVTVRDGDEVTAGDVIGAAGSSGNSTGPHLHFEVRRDGIPEDPTLDVSLP